MHKKSLYALFYFSPAGGWIRLRTGDEGLSGSRVLSIDRDACSIPVAVVNKSNSNGRGIETDSLLWSFTELVGDSQLWKD